MAIRERTIEEKLAAFAQRWQNYSGTEISDAQGFLRELLTCYGEWTYAPGTIFEQHPVKPKDEAASGLFPDAPGGKKPKPVTAERMDLYIPQVVVWEQKGPGEHDLARHHTQLLLYWARTRTRYMVLCNFREFWIYDTDNEGGQNDPLYRFTLAELPDKHGMLNFLKGEETFFAQRGARVTRDAAQYVGKVLRDLVLTSDDPARERPRYSKFTLECVFAMFAEDVGILKGGPFTAALKKAQATGDMGAVFNLFDDLGRADDYDRGAAVPYVNGPLFDQRHPKLAMARELIANLYVAAHEFDWAEVRPEVFGSIFESALLQPQRQAAGAHFTSEADIMKVVGPTVVRPWRERIATCKTRKEADALIERMCAFHILDPACGSGNFLYVAYREMKRLESALRTKHFELWQHKEQKRASEPYPAPKPGPWFALRQLHGIDSLLEAVELTRVVLWIGAFLANDELNLGEVTLPLAPLDDTVLLGDALFVDWPRPDGELAIVGNPPFMGRAGMRAALGDDYVNKLHKAFPLNRNADLVTYWYPKALETLRPGERAGFVSTNSIAQNESREASLDRIIAAGGTLHDCWKSYPWPGEAAVHVSIVNWIQQAFGGARYLNGEAVILITAGLTDTVDLSAARVIPANRSLCFEGVQPGNKEFIVSASTRDQLISKDPRSVEVIHPYLIGMDVNREINQQPARFAIDFGNMPEVDAQRFKSAFLYVREHVYPAKINETDRKTKGEKARWWQFKRPAPDMRAALAGLSQFLVAPVTSPHVLMHIVNSGVIIDHALKAIALDSYYHFGILQSAIHEAWAWARGSTLEERLRYTNTTIFETFPFPPGARAAGPRATGKKTSLQGEQAGGPPALLYDPRAVPDTREAKTVARIAGELYTKRQAACLALGLGLTKLYNYIKGKTPLSGLISGGVPAAAPQDGDKSVAATGNSGGTVAAATPAERIAELQTLHEQLNAAVCACYGWAPDTWRNENEVLARLLELNHQISGNYS